MEARVWLNGSLVEASRAQVPFLTPGLHYGIAVFEGIRCYTADEVFICGTAAEVVGLSEIDVRTIGIGRTGPITTAFQDVFHTVVTGRHARSAEWLAPVTVDTGVRSSNCQVLET